MRMIALGLFIVTSEETVISAKTDPPT